jgi:hypothetical protein
MWPICHKVKYLPTFATLYGFNFVSQTFVAATLAKLRLGKVWLGTKQAHNLLVVTACIDRSATKYDT